MSEDSRLLADNRTKAQAALRLLMASLDGYVPFDPSATLTPKQLEPYDALADRFIRAVESSLRLFRSIELHEFGVPSDSTREMLDRMEKLRWVSSADLWMAMRSIRNKIVHDYLPRAGCFDVCPGCRPIRTGAARAGRAVDPHALNDEP